MPSKPHVYMAHEQDTFYNLVFQCEELSLGMCIYVLGPVKITFNCFLLILYGSFKTKAFLMHLQFNL